MAHMPRNRTTIDPTIRKQLTAVAKLRERADTQSRAAVHDALDAGTPIRDIAELTGLSTRTVQNWKAEGRVQ